MDTIAIAYSELRSYGCSACALKSLLMNNCRFTMVEVDSQLRHARGDSGPDVTLQQLSVQE